jgi:type I site-specific restriction endonuclease
MGIRSFLLHFLRQKNRPEAIESLGQSLQSLESPKGSDSITSQSTDIYQTAFLPNVVKPTAQSTLLKPAEIDESSFKLGVASGYTGHSIRNIEGALNRIESQMVTRDWFSVQFEDRTPELLREISSLHQEMLIHEKNEEKRFEIIQNILEKMKTIANIAPTDVKFNLLDQIKAVESQLPLTRKMEEVLSVVKTSNKISYEDLAAKLNITVSALRGLLSTTLQRTDKIERFIIDGKGWVRLKEA